MFDNCRFDINNLIIEECIVCACNQYFINGKEYLITGLRHFDPLMQQQLNTLNELYGDDFEIKQKHTQGFITNKRRFVDRKEGLQIALNAGQINYRTPKSGTETPFSIRESDILFSEDLY